MRTYLWTAALMFLSAATAAAQLVPVQPKADGDKPPGAKADRGGDAGKREGGAAPNAMFTAIDADGDGVISKVELKKAIVALKTLDSDSDGSITLAEASAGAPAQGNGAWKASNPLVDQMLQNDRNGDGKLTPDEIPQQAMPMLQNADSNKDGELDRDELAAVARNMNKFQNSQNGFGGLARGGRGGDPTGKLLQYDQNGDGMLSLQEIPQQMRGAFRPEDDLNKDGAVDAAELQAVIARMGGRAKGINPAGNGRTPGRDIEDRARKREAKLNQ